MKSYKELIEQTFDFPTIDFTIKNNTLCFRKIPLIELIERYGTPLRISYLPKIKQNIQNTNRWFRQAIEKLNYGKQYIYSYCTKASHFSFVVEEVIKHGAFLETSSGYDLDIVKKLYKTGKINKDFLVVCNGFKREAYKKGITELVNSGFKNVIPVLDNLTEVDYYKQQIGGSYQIGIRVATDEEPKFEFYTSRLGIRYRDVLDLYKGQIQNEKNINLKMLHFFINTGIKDSTYYWSELNKFIHKYCELKNICPELDTIDIGGGLPIKNSLHFDFDYPYMIEEIVRNIKDICDKNNTQYPHIVTEFGTYTVGETGALIYSILDKKMQNDKELWYMIDGSFITHLPDSYSLNQRYIMLAINHWENRFDNVKLGGLTCDSYDYYNSEAHSSEVFLPDFHQNQTLYIGFFNTGAYQDSLGGYYGLQHCLIPSPQHVIIQENENGILGSKLFVSEQRSDTMLNVLGY